MYLYIMYIRIFCIYLVYNYVETSPCIQHINETNPEGMEGKLASAFVNLFGMESREGFISVVSEVMVSHSKSYNAWQTLNTLI